MPKSWWEKKSKEDEQTFEELNLAHRRSQAKCQLVHSVTLSELNCSCFCHIINILLTELSRSVWENLDLGRGYRPQCVQSVLTTSVKIHPYRPPARLIRVKYWLQLYIYEWGSGWGQLKTDKWPKMFLTTNKTQLTTDICSKIYWQLTKGFSHCYSFEIDRK